MHAYTVHQQTKRATRNQWQRTTWPVVARDKDSARTEAREAAKVGGLIVGECFVVIEHT